MDVHSPTTGNNTYPLASTVVSFLTEIESCEVSECQERASSKRFQKNVLLPVRYVRTGPPQTVCAANLGVFCQKNANFSSIL